MGPRVIKDKFHAYLQSFHKNCSSRDEENLYNFENTSEINSQLHEGTLRWHVYHIQGNIIEGTPFSASTNDNRQAPIRIKFNSISSCCQQK